MENLSVLVLDHDPVSLLTICNMLAKFNFKVLPFQTAEEALDSLEKGIAKDEELDLIVAEVHPGNTAVGTLVLFRHILTELEVPLITMCGYDEAVSECMTLGACFNVVKPLDTKTVNILMMKALQHRSRRVIPEGSSIVKKTQSRMDSSSTKNHGSETEEDEEQDVLNENDYSNNLGRFVWCNELHEKFLQAVEVLGASATARKIHRYMNVKDLNLTSQHIASHLQKHRLRTQRLSHGEEGYQHYASMKQLSELISSAYNAASPKPNNHPATTQMQFTHGVASAIWDKYPGMVWPQVEESSAASAIWYKYPGKLWPQVEESSAGAQVSKTNALTPPVLKHGTKSVWDRYDESLQYYDESRPKSFSLSYKRKVLPVKSKAIDEYGGKIVIDLERETSRTEAAGKIVIDLESDDMHEDTMDDAHAAVSPQKDTMDEVHATVSPQKVNEVPAAAMGAGDLVDLGSDALLDDIDNYHPTAEKAPSDPFCDWEEVEAFWTSQLEGQEQQGLAPDMLQVDDAWNQALQPVNPAKRRRRRTYGSRTRRWRCSGVKS